MNYATLIPAIQMSLADFAPETVSEIITILNVNVPRLSPKNKVFNFLGLSINYIATDDYNFTFDEEPLIEYLSKLDSSPEDKDPDQYKPPVLEEAAIFGDYSKLNIKKIQFQPLSEIQAKSSIASEVYSMFPMESRETLLNDIKQLLVSLTYDPSYIYQTRSNKIIFSYQEVLYITEIGKKVFHAVDSITVEILKSTNILPLILGDNYTSYNIVTAATFRDNTDIVGF